MHLAELKRRAEAVFAATHEAIEERRRIVLVALKHLAKVRAEEFHSKKAVSHRKVYTEDAPKSRLNR